MPNFTKLKDKDQGLENVQNSILNTTSSLTNLFDTTENHETRIASLESQAPQNNSNLTIPNYFKFLGSSDRKAIVCGVATENHLDILTMQELGYECDVTYRQTSKGEKASCRCNRL